MPTVVELNEKVQMESAFIEDLQKEISSVIVGQKYLIDRLLIGLLCQGHILLEGVPGLAKTLSVNTLARCVQADFKRIQFTPDLLPSDLLGTLIYNQKTGDFVPRRGPIFSNIVLADEINRAPSKVQSALLECMQEHQVTIGDVTYPLPGLFIVLATQNPIEQEGTYPLPEAQVDRFMFKLRIDYPTKAEEKEILDRNSQQKLTQVNPVVTPERIKQAQEVVEGIYVDDKIKDYILNIVHATRNPTEYGIKDIASFIEYGASPRASLYLLQGARAHAFLRRRGYVTPEDVKAVVFDVLRHRVILSYEADAEAKTPEMLIQAILDQIEVP